MPDAQTLHEYVEEGQSPPMQETVISSEYWVDNDDEPPLVSVSLTPSDTDDNESEGQYEELKHGVGRIHNDLTAKSLKYPSTPTDHDPDMTVLDGGATLQRSDNRAKGMVTLQPSRKTHDGGFGSVIRSPIYDRNGSVGGISQAEHKLSLTNLSMHSPTSPARSISPGARSNPSIAKKPKYNAFPSPNIHVKRLKQEDELTIRNGAGVFRDTIADSPILSQFAVDRREIPIETALARIKETPPPPSTGSPDSVQTLPSLSMALGPDPLSPCPVSSPRLSRQNSIQFGPPLVPTTSLPSMLSTAMSPGYSGGSNLASYITNRGRASSVSTPMEIMSVSTPGLTWSSHSPGASIPTPHGNPSAFPYQPPSMSHMTVYAAQQTPHLIAEPSTCSSASVISPASSTTISEQHSVTSSTTQSSNGINPVASLNLTHLIHTHLPQSQSQFEAPIPAGAPLYHCPHTHCTSQPFATQYLLNSHLNVHSENRPHFCSVKGCPRGLGGQGFKRKNEMIRHGLVHTSPGYTCPFCPGNGPQHRYPRPDNLQRHVRVHHKEVGRDDVRLREVLGQRGMGLVGDVFGTDTGSGYSGIAPGNNKNRRRRIS